MMLNYTMNKNIVIEARENCRVPVPVERCPRVWRDQKKDDQQEQMSKYPNRTLRNFFNELKSLFKSIILDYHVRKSDAELLQLSCSKHISDSVQLNWSLLGTETKGTASLRGITLSSAMLSIITVAPLKWSKFISLIKADKTFLYSKFNEFCRRFNKWKRNAINIGNIKHIRPKYSSPYTN